MQLSLYRAFRSKVTSSETLLIIRILSATFTKKGHTMSRMDPFCIVNWKPEGGERTTVGHTHTDWNGHMHPHWDHTCRGIPYQVGLRGEVEFTVSETSLVGVNRSFRGQVVVKAETLVSESALGDDIPQVGHTLPGQPVELDLTVKQDVVGSLTVQCFLVRHDSTALDYRNLKRMNPMEFKSPVRSLGVSGGTATFYRLMLDKPQSGFCVEHYVGKDLAHAHDEIHFYEAARLAREQPTPHDMKPLLNFMFEYGGVLSSRTEHCEEEKDLLVLGNLFAGGTMRVIDVKIGHKTAQAGWAGKSRSSALRNSAIDGMTNTHAEGFRLEGFDNPPPALTSVRPLLERCKVPSRTSHKALLRFSLQVMTGFEIMHYFLDFHQEPFGCETDFQKYWSPSELAELFLAELVVRLVILCRACRCALVPQKWIGSSIALACNVATVPSRQVSVEELREHVKVHIFDWGRSEFGTLASHNQLVHSKQKDRAKFWTSYVGGVDRFALEAVRAHWDRFNSVEWSDVTFIVMDFDVLTANDFLGKVRVPLMDTVEKTVLLRGASGKYLQGKASLSYSISWVPLPAGGRLRGLWRVAVLRCSCLPWADANGASDPYVELVARSQNGRHRCIQRTSVRCNTLNPEFDETLELPIASESTLLEDSLREGGMDEFEIDKIVPDDFDDRVTMTCCGGAADHDNAGTPLMPAAAIAHWQKYLDEAEKKHNSVTWTRQKTTGLKSEARTSDMGKTTGQTDSNELSGANDREIISPTSLTATPLAAMEAPGGVTAENGLLVSREISDSISLEDDFSCLASLQKPCCYLI